MSDQLDTAIRRVLNHMAHHRGQLTVYLRLNDERFRPSGPSADEGKRSHRGKAKQCTLPVLFKSIAYD